MEFEGHSSVGVNGHCVNSGQPELFVKLGEGIQFLHLKHKRSDGFCLGFPCSFCSAELFEPCLGFFILQCQLERELIRYVKRYLCQPQVTIITNDKQFAFMCELYDYVENTELPPEMVSSLMKTKNVLELSWDEWMMNIEVEDMEDSIKKVAELLRERKI